MKKSLLTLLFICFFMFQESGLSASEEAVLTLRPEEISLRKLIQKYQIPSFQMSIKQDIFLSIIKTNLSSEGILFIKHPQFRLDLKGKPSSLTLFDGSFLWHQADKTEKLVFKIKNPMQFQILTNFFDSKSFFDNFQISKYHKKGSLEFYSLDPKKDFHGLEQIFMKAGTFIIEIRLIWKDLNNWQKYTFSPPLKKNLPEETFKFSSTGFQVLDQ
ncbi:MAG: outer membrane lipoprotein carrier protein LolA [Bdellovibrionaceae bacterium]|nr:outer membrane lipoprotein carrier protein LolA [Pseudobdellovibrionaceae bacterium]